ncbi:MAG: gamma carbonic anhydrase family protein [Bergeyella sp.]|nr:gamma carbonic anhydrase family protein [Bergeyella sp.]
MAIVKQVLGKAPRMGEGTFLAENAVVIGDVSLGRDCSVWYHAVLRGDVHFISVGDGVNIQDHAMLHCTYEKYPLIIGSNVSIGHRAIVHGCTIKDNVLVGMGAIVMDNCMVEENSIVGAGALVTQGTRVRSGEVWGGVPARKIKNISTELLKGEVHRIASNYVRYASWHKEQSTDRS